jgi:predicted amidohydrolase YtcJ
MVHCQTVRDDQLDRMAEIGMVASFFLDHIHFWGDYHYTSVLGHDRGMHISPIREALKRGINYTMHQDSPVVNPNALFAVHNAVNRKTPAGRVLGEDQKLTAYEALKAVTINGAYQIFEEDSKGSITAGKLADLVILDSNPLKVDGDKIKDIVVLETIKEGKTIYSA